MPVVSLGPLDPLDAAQALVGLGGLAWLDSAAPDPERGRYSYIAAAPAAWFEIRQGRVWRDGVAVAGEPLAGLRAALGPVAPLPVKR